MLVTDGTLHVGDIMIAGPAWGKVRAMTDEHGRNVRGSRTRHPGRAARSRRRARTPATRCTSSKTPRSAQEIADTRKTKVKNLVPASAKVSLEDLAKRMAEADQLELRLVIKADVQGSVEAVADALAKLSTEKVRVAIIHAGVGAITEGDINLALASKSIVVGFDVRPAGKAASLAESEAIEIRLYNIIYNAVDDVRKAMAGLLAPTLVEKPLGKAEVRQVFKVGKVGTVAGCMVTDGTIKRSGARRLMRDGVAVWEGKIGGLRRFKDDVRSGRRRHRVRHHARRLHRHQRRRHHRVLRDRGGRGHSVSAAPVHGSLQHPKGAFIGHACRRDEARARDSRGAGRSRTSGRSSARSKSG